MSRLLPRLLLSGGVLWVASCSLLTDFDGLGGETTAAGAVTGSMGGGGSGAGGSGAAGGGIGGGAAAAGGSAGSGGGTGGIGGNVGGQGGSGCAPEADYSGLVINEMMPDGNPEDWVELKNNGAAALSLCGVLLTQDYNGSVVPIGGDRYTFTSGSIGPGQYLVLERYTDFLYGFDKDLPERVTLFAPDESVIDDTTYMGVPYTTAQSWARVPDGAGAFQKVSPPTRGTSN